MPICRDVFKNRHVQFLNKLSGSDDAHKARQLLSNVQGIETVTLLRTGKLRLRYDVRELTLQMIEDALRDVGFLLDNNLLCRIKRGLIAYCEDTQRASLGVEHDAEQSILSQSDTLAHDPRPHNWRNYL
jgi:hypothetical protein